MNSETILNNILYERTRPCSLDAKCAIAKLYLDANAVKSDDDMISNVVRACDKNAYVKASVIKGTSEYLQRMADSVKQEEPLNTLHGNQTNDNSLLVQLIFEVRQMRTEMVEVKEELKLLRTRYEVTLAREQNDVDCEVIKNSHNKPTENTNNENE
uniref:uncharacterized protein LOC101243018 n=1 Tax=Ciona intestinalis TaxID=7719 RepID=UPI0002B8D735|nr:uncharacterized protein LOC101243018 [Ciona intestinalis]|eukprot:XP_004225691.1 uncharacterized protein LOC101243018 [Ciona intestinalis]